MIYFNNDYCEGCHPKILEKLTATNMEQTPGYGTDGYCLRAAQRIKTLCRNESLDVHFLVGGTQTNLTVIDALLRPHQGVLGAESAHVAVHETGAIEATGHKVLTLPSSDGKITAEQVDAYVREHYTDEAFEHTVQPGMVYISSPSELGTVYHKAELEKLSAVCHKHGLYLFLDGARLAYGLTAQENDVTMEDLARLCDVFYIGGTKVGALFGEAVVFSDRNASRDFRYLIKQHGGMLAKGRLLGVQFDVLLEEGLYFELGRHANALADTIRQTLDELGYPYLVPGTTNQIFPILPDRVIARLQQEFAFSLQQPVGEKSHCVRFCTSWATKAENVAALCDALREISK